MASMIQSYHLTFFTVIIICTGVRVVVIILSVLE